MTPLEFLRRQLAALLEQRAGLITAFDAITAAAVAEQRTALTAEEQTRADKGREDITKLDGEISAQEERIAAQEQIEHRSQQARLSAANAGDQGGRPGDLPAPSGVTVGAEPMTYHRAARSSYFLDLVRSQLNIGDGDGGPSAARSRLERHAAEMRVELPAREARRDDRARQEVRSIHGMSGRPTESVFEKRVNPNRTDGQGGNFVPPLWLVDQYIDLPRFGRTVANSVRNLTLPSGTDSINLPKVATGTATAIQTADAGAVQSTDLTDTSVTAPVRTIAGQQDVAMQLLDQSPISFDEVVFGDLIADYNAKLDIQVINGSGASGQMGGILGVSGINAVTYTDASPTLPELWLPLLQAASQVAKNRKLPALAVFSTPSIWYWALSQLDSQSRPFMLPAANAFNPLGLQTGAAAGEGYVGDWTFGLPHLNDGNIPSNLGGGTNETRIIVARTSDLFLWEGSMRTRVMSEVLSNTLQVRLQVYNYAAFMGNRRPEAISVISGTGLIPASGF